MSFLAPQAYTKETLAKAFDWLQHQPANIKQAATTPDTLVSLYLRAQRHGIKSLDGEATASSKQFLHDLETLKKDFAAFEDPSEKTEPVPQQSVPQAPVPPPPQQAQFEQPSTVPPQMPPAPRQSSPVQPTNSSAPTSSRISLDSLTKKYIEETQKRFNLSQPEEAMRLLISVGYKATSRWE